MSPLIAQGERGHRGPPIIFRTRFTASHAGFFIFNQSLERPERYGESLRFETMPSSPILHACWKTSKQAMAVFSSQANSLAVDDARSRAQARHGLYDERELAGQVVAGATVQPHPRHILAGYDPEAVVLDLMQPGGAGRRAGGFCGEARRDEPGEQDVDART